MWCASIVHEAYVHVDSATTATGLSGSAIVQTPISAALHANNHEIAELIREYIGESGARLHAGGDAPKTEL